LLLPALDRHAQVGSVLERGVLGGVVDAAAAAAEALGRAVDGDLAIEETLSDGRLNRADDKCEVER